MTRRNLLIQLSSFLAILLSPLAGLLSPRRSSAALECDGKPATSSLEEWAADKRYEDVIVLDQRRGARGRGTTINGNQIFYSGWRKVVFNNKDYGTVAFKSPINKNMHRRLKDV